LTAAALTATASSRDRKASKFIYDRLAAQPDCAQSIYTTPDQPVELEQTPTSAIEYNIALGRIYAEKTYFQTHNWVKDRVGDWIAVEEKVERKCFHLLELPCTVVQL
jgi:hypothetical protein